MSRSSPPASLIEPEPPDELNPSGSSARTTSHTRALSLQLARAIRWLHIYASMLGLAIVVFFSATGLTLNHPGWFAARVETRREFQGRMDPAWLAADSLAPPGADPTQLVRKLEIVEHLRKAHRLSGSVTYFQVDEGECSVTFKGPGYAADAFIDRRSGIYQGAETLHGVVAILNDLHKGRDTGPVWSLVIDASAVIALVISLSGLLLIFYLKLRRRPGLVTAVVGLTAALVLYFCGVP